MKEASRRTQNGDIILLHNGTNNTAAILPKILVGIGVQI